MTSLRSHQEEPLVLVQETDPYSKRIAIMKYALLGAAVLVFCMLLWFGFPKPGVDAQSVGTQSVSFLPKSVAQDGATGLVLQNETPHGYRYIVKAESAFHQLLPKSGADKGRIRMQSPWMRITRPDGTQIFASASDGFLQRDTKTLFLHREARIWTLEGLLLLGETLHIDLESGEIQGTDSTLRMSDISISGPRAVVHERGESVIFLGESRMQTSH